MSITSLSKVGNSMAVLLPKTLREEAGIDPATALRLSSPRKGVIVITALKETTDARLEAFREAEARIEDNAADMKSWPKGKTAAELVEEVYHG